MKRPDSSITARADSPCCTALQAASSWSAPGPTTGGSRSMIISAGTSAGASSSASIGTRPTSRPSTHTATLVAHS